MADDRVKLIRRWLMMGAKPTTIVATDARSEVTNVQFNFGDTWISVARSLDACEPIRLQAFDSEKNLLRATTLESLACVDPEDIESEQRDKQAAPATQDEHTLVTFGKLLASAYESANVKVVQSFVDKAFDRLAGMFDALVEQNAQQAKSLASLERSLLRTSELLQHATATEVERAMSDTGDDEPSMLETMVRTFSQAQRQANKDAAAQKSNGKAEGPQI